MRDVRRRALAVLAFVGQNWRLLLAILGVGLVVRGIRAWSPPAADVFTGGMLAGLAMFPYIAQLRRTRVNQS